MDDEQRWNISAEEMVKLYRERRAQRQRFVLRTFALGAFSATAVIGFIEGATSGGDWLYFAIGAALAWAFVWIGL